MDAIRVEHLSKAFDGVAAVDDLTLRVAEGEIFSLVGPDGAGKTTTMRLLTGIMDPTGGDAWVAGHHIVSESEALKEKIGYMSQRFGLYPDLSVLENIHFYADIYGEPRRGRQAKVDRLLEFSNLAPFKRRLAGNLSGGMKQKLGLACALIHTPQILFLDEPTNGVDPVSRRDFWRILYQLLRQKVTIFVSTAYLDEAERASRVGLIHHGRLLACGSPDEVKRMMRGVIWEICCEQPRKAAAALRHELAADSVGLFGDRIHVVSRQPEQTRADAERILAAAGMALAGIRRIEPTLEDVFVSVLGEEDSPADPSDQSEESGPTRMTTGSANKAVTVKAVTVKAVTVKDLVKRFGSFVAVDRVSFEVAEGEIFGFLGPNGAGKSTTIRMLCGILAPTSGQGTVGGFDIFTQAERIKANIGYMSQKFSLYDDLTVEENIDFYSGIYRIPAARKQQRKQWVIEMAGLGEHRRARTSILSSGWKQRLALGCAILHEPRIVFLDEPTSGVDPISRRRFWDLIYEMAAQGVTVFVTTHYMEEAEYCDRLALIYRGELIAVGPPEVLKHDLMTEDVLEIVCDQPESVMDRIESLPSVKDVALFGTSLHLVARDGRQAEADVRRCLAEAGSAIRKIEPIAPSLEDVFVSLIEARDREIRPQEEVRR